MTRNERRAARVRWDRRKVETTQEAKTYRCNECGEPVCATNPELTPCRCARAVAAEW